jgi:hypothetical protein
MIVLASLFCTALSSQNIVHQWLTKHEQRGLHSKPAFIPLYPLDGHAINTYFPHNASGFQ